MCYVYIQCTFITRVLRHDCSMRHFGPWCSTGCFSHAMAYAVVSVTNAITVICALSGCSSPQRAQSVVKLVCADHVQGFFLPLKADELKGIRKYRTMLTCILSSAEHLSTRRRSCKAHVLLQFLSRPRVNAWMPCKFTILRACDCCM